MTDVSPVDNPKSLNLEKELDPLGDPLKDHLVLPYRSTYRKNLGEFSCTKTYYDVLHFHLLIIL